MVSSVTALINDFTMSDAAVTVDPSGLRSTIVALGMDRHRHIRQIPRKGKACIKPGHYGTDSSGPGWRIIQKNARLNRSWSLRTSGTRQK